jgi:hypothetical protein
VQAALIASASASAARVTAKDVAFTKRLPLQTGLGFVYRAEIL